MNETVQAGWPEGKTLALMVNVMLEGWPDDSPPHVPTSNPVKAGYMDTRGRSWAAYGPKCGAPRLLKRLKARGVKATFFTSGSIAERFPELVARIFQDGHSVQCHGYYQNLPPLYFEEEQEREMIVRCKEILGKVTGRSPRGWLSPRVTPSLRTAANLVREGFTWHSDVCDADLPYRQQAGGGSIIAVPFDNDVNDHRIHLSMGESAQAFSEILARALRMWYGPHREQACLNITAHAHVFGRPYGAAEFEAALEIAQSCPFGWITTQDELVQKTM